MTNSVEAQNLGVRHVDYYGSPRARWRGLSANVPGVFGSISGALVVRLESKVASGDGKDLIHFVSRPQNGPVSGAAAVLSTEAAGDCPVFRDEGG